MTWGEFKKQLEEEGVTDEMSLAYIDISGYEELRITPSDEKGGVMVTSK